MELVYGTILLALIEYIAMGALVSRARAKHGIHAPAMTGHPEFERANRVHVNTLENLIIFVPAVWIFATYTSVMWAAILGALFVVARALYAVGYLQRREAQRCAVSGASSLSFWSSAGYRRRASAGLVTGGSSRTLRCWARSLRHGPMRRRSSTTPTRQDAHDRQARRGTGGDGVLDKRRGQCHLVVDLHQLDPVEFAPPSQRSDFASTTTTMRCTWPRGFGTRKAERITAQVRARAKGSSEDRFSVILDPYLDRRNGYRFQVNPNGVRGGALPDTSNLESNWDGIWSARPRATTRVGRPRWRSRQTLSFNPNTATGASTSSGRSSGTARLWDGCRAIDR